jgi:hypothetical protein
MLFVSFGIMGSVVGIVLNLVDYQNGSVLNGTHHGKSNSVTRDTSLSSLSDAATTDTESLLANEY